MVIGIVGGPGTGKTYLALYLTTRLQALFIEGDATGHQMLEDKAVQSALVAAFGENVVKEGQVDRGYLGDIVFKDREALQTLNAIMHPRMKALIGETIGATDKPFVVLEAAVMLEAGFDAFVDLMIEVRADEAIRLKRLTENRQIDRARAKGMMASGRKDYHRYSHMTVDTSCGIEIIKKELNRCLDGLTAMEA